MKRRRLLVGSSNNTQVAVLLVGECFGETDRPGGRRAQSARRKRYVRVRPCNVLLPTALLARETEPTSAVQVVVF